MESSYEYGAKFVLSPAAPKARDGRYCNAPRPSGLSVRLSVCPSVCLSVCLSVCPSRLVFAL